MLPPGTARMYGESALVEDMSGVWRTSSTLYLCASCLELASNVHKDFTITDGHLNTVSRREIGMLAQILYPTSTSLHPKFMSTYISTM